VRAEIVPGSVGMGAVVAVLVFVYFAFPGIADRTLFGPWLAVMAMAPVGLAVLVGVHFLRRPSDHEVLRVWLPVCRVVRTWLNIAVIASPWVLLPGAEPLLRSLMLMLYVFFLATEVLANNDPQGLTWVALAGVPVSLSLFLFWQHAPYAVALSLFLGVAGLTLFLLERRLNAAKALALETGLALDAGTRASLQGDAALPRSGDDSTSGAAGLTARQIDVARLLADGLSNKDIARRLGVAPATVKTHVAQIIAITGSEPDGIPAVPMPPRMHRIRTMICCPNPKCRPNTWARNSTVTPSNNAVP